MKANPPRPNPAAPRNPEAMSTEDFYRELFAKAQNGTLEELGASARPARPAPQRPVNPANPEAISTEEFYRQIFAEARQAGRGQAATDRPQESAPPRPEPPGPEPRDQEPQSLEDFYRDLFAQAEGRKPLVLGPREGLEPPALPARFKRLRGGNQLVSYELLVGEDGRIAAKHENVAGRETYFIYEYDDTGHLLQVWRNGHLAEEYAYDGRGARIAAWNPKQGQWKYGYDHAGRLTAAGPWGFAYAADGSLREAWTPQSAYFFSADPAAGLSRVVLPRGRVLRSVTMAPGLPVEKYVDARLVESLTWRSPLQLGTYRDHERDLRMEFHYAQGRLPQAVTVRTPQGTTTYLLGYDQVGSLKAVAALDGPNEGRVVKAVDYDAFGNILADSNPSLFLPLAFAGGLRDRLTGLVRFCHRDYDPTIGRFTAPDPLGDTGGDHDLYDYCVDEPVGRIDPEGLFLIPLLYGLGGLAGATGLGWGGVKLAQKGAEVAAETMGDDTLKAELPAKVEAMDKGTDSALKMTTGINAGIGGAATAIAAAPTLARGAVTAAKEIPGAAAKAAEIAKGAATTAGQVATSMVLDPKNIQNTSEFVSGFLDPGPPPPSIAGTLGSGAAWVKNSGSFSDQE